MNKLNYDNAAALINAFRQGAKFKITRGGSTSLKVIDISPAPVNLAQKRYGLQVRDEAGYLWVNYLPDGTNPGLGHQIVRDESLGFERTTVTVGDSMFDWTPAKKDALLVPRRHAVGYPPAPAKPFLEQFVTGSPAYCPKTRETVVSVEFRKGSLDVCLQPEGKGGILKRRTSTNYRHDGTHKHDPARSLVIGELPPPPAPKVREYTAEELFTTAPQGVYEVKGWGSFEAVVLVNGSSRSALFVQGGHVDQLGRGAWDGTPFLLTPKRFHGRTK